MTTEGDWHRLISQPRYRMVLDEDVWVTARDGVRLCVDIYRPDAEGKFPGLLSLSNYGKTSQKLPTDPVFQPSDYVRGSGGHESGEQNYFVPRGYVQVIPDVRGVGKSQGEFVGDWYKDGYDIVEWMAKQNWCDGNIGMLGMSQFAIAQFMVAAAKPPHLKAIAPFEGLTDWYRHHYYHGGILNYYFANSYRRLLPVRKLGEAASFREFSEEQLRAKIRDLQEDPDIRCIPYLFLATECPEMNPLIFDLLLHSYDGEFYKRISPYTTFDDIHVPAFLGSRWNGGVLHLPGAFDAFGKLATPQGQKKLTIVPSDNYGGMDRPFHEVQDLILRFYDHWLKGLDTGMMEEPPIMFLVQGINKWRYEAEFPLSVTEWQKFYLREGGRLSIEPPDLDPEPHFFVSDPWADPMQGFARADSLADADPVPKVVYETGPLSENLEVTGPLALHWYASIESAGIPARIPSSADLGVLEPATNDTDWYLKLFDVDVDGSDRCVAEGWLKASHHEVDELKSKPYAPFHPHTRSLGIEPGEVIPYACDMRMISNVFLMGHRIRLEISGQDQVQALWYHVPHMARVTHRIFSTKGSPSYLLLPVIPKNYEGAGEPAHPPAGPFRIPKFRRSR
jgi:uncharacterized protein